MADWRPIETCPQDGFFIVHQDGAVRAMFRERGEWRSTSVAIDGYGDIIHNAKVRETAVYEPTHWMDIPEPPTST
jgi:hypothetical protein